MHSGGPHSQESNSSHCGYYYYRFVANFNSTNPSHPLSKPGSESHLSNFNAVGKLQLNQRLLNQMGQELVHGVLADIIQVVVARKKVRSVSRCVY